MLTCDIHIHDVNSRLSSAQPRRVGPGANVLVAAVPWLMRVSLCVHGYLRHPATQAFPDGRNPTQRGSRPVPSCQVEHIESQYHANARPIARIPSSQLWQCHSFRLHFLPSNLSRAPLPQPHSPESQHSCRISALAHELHPLALRPNANAFYFSRRGRS